MKGIPGSGAGLGGGGGGAIRFVRRKRAEGYVETSNAESEKSQISVVSLINQLENSSLNN